MDMKVEIVLRDSLELDMLTSALSAIEDRRTKLAEAPAPVGVQVPLQVEPAPVMYEAPVTDAELEAALRDFLARHKGDLVAARAAMATVGLTRLSEAPTLTPEQRTTLYEALSA